MNDQLPALIDSRGLQDELGVKRATAEQIMRHCETIIRVGRKVFVYREEALEVIHKLEQRKRVPA